MTETFCGKDCDLCQEKLSEACRGCKEGPGRRFGGDCPLRNVVGTSIMQTVIPVRKL